MKSWAVLKIDLNIFNQYPIILHMKECKKEVQNFFVFPTGTSGTAASQPESLLGSVKQ